LLSALKDVNLIKEDYFKMSYFEKRFADGNFYRPAVKPSESKREGGSPCFVKNAGGNWWMKPFYALIAAILWMLPKKPAVLTAAAS
jgi:hypothetical protein